MAPAPLDAINTTATTRHQDYHHGHRRTPIEKEEEGLLLIEDSLVMSPTSSDRKGWMLKWGSFLVLVMQTTAHTLVLRRSRIEPGPAYIPSTAVLLSELLKFLISLGAHLFLELPTTPTTSSDSNYVLHQLSHLPSKMFGPSSDFHLMSLPALLYFLQNILNYQAATYLDPATFQITAQMKILSTALFSVWLLDRKISRGKWSCLAMILCGVIIVQLQSSPSPKLPSSSSSTSTIQAEKETSNRLFGMVCVLASSTTSGFAGVWFERCLKGSGSRGGGGGGGEVSLVMRNLQLSFASLVVGFITGVCILDRQTILAHGFLYGYTFWTYLTILLISLGGLLVSFVVKYADSILKVLATTLAFLASTTASIWLFDFKVGIMFLLGSFIVLSGSQMYILGPPSSSTLLRPLRVLRKWVIRLLGRGSEGGRGGILPPSLMSPSLPVFQRGGGNNQQQGKLD